MLLSELLKGSIRLLLKEDRIGILFSGGLDSSILTKLILDEVTEKQVDIVTVGMKDSYDIKNAVQRAVELGFQLNCCYLDKSIVKSSITCLTEKNIVSGIRELSIAIPLYLGMKFLSDSCESKMVVLGQGADELFGGYNKYSILYKESKMEELEKCMKTDLENLISKQLVMEREIALNCNLVTVYPFLSPKIINYAKTISVSKHLIETNNNTIIRKIELRKLAKILNLSDSIVNQPKKALQYGSGTISLLRKIAKEDGYTNLPVWFRSVI
ncbi:MAG: asparagine synthase C-terminal domain-containing protein [Candidatus Hodarchaeales archaeon]